MRFSGHFKDFQQGLNGSKQIIFTVENYVDKAQINALDNSKLYSIEVKESKSKRSIEQNKLLWKLIHQIAKHTGHDDNDIYCLLLERADALSDYIITSTEMSETLRHTFRGIKFMRMQEVNGKECYIYKVYLGSSKMNTKEFSELLDECIKLASEVGVEYDILEWGS